MWTKKPKQFQLDPKTESAELVSSLYGTHPSNYILFIEHTNASRHIYEYISAWCYTETKRNGSKDEKTLKAVITALVDNPTTPSTALSMLWHSRLTIWEDNWHEKIVTHPNATVEFLLNIYLNPYEEDLNPSPTSTLKDLMLERPRKLAGNALLEHPEWKTYLLNKIRTVSAEDCSPNLPYEWVTQIYKQLLPDDVEIIRLLTIDDKPPF